MLFEAGFGVLLLATYFVNQKREAEKANDLNPSIAAQRNVIFDTAINGVHDSGKLMELSYAFRSQGLDVQADMLEARAKLASATPEEKEARREIFRRALESKDKNAVLEVANAFDSQGATGAAKSLREYALGLPDTNETPIT